MEEKMSHYFRLESLPLDDKDLDYIQDFLKNARLENRTTWSVLVRGRTDHSYEDVVSRVHALMKTMDFDQPIVFLEVAERLKGFSKDVDHTSCKAKWSCCFPSSVFKKERDIFNKANSLQFSDVREYSDRIVYDPK
jgi:hypothetical protein